MRIGLTASTFDLLHAGHIEMLREAKAQCDYLICALQIDPAVDRPEKNRPVQTIVERYTQLEAVKFVDEIIPYLHETDLEDILQMRPIGVRILGDEYRDNTDNCGSLEDGLESCCAATHTCFNNFTLSVSMEPHNSKEEEDFDE